MKKSVLSVALVASLALGYGVVHADWEVGWDEPYDPPAYYSQTEISYPDSAPSPFALRDLEAQGGTVYDYTRHTHNLVTTANDISTLAVLSSTLELEELNTQPIDEAFLQRNAEDIEAYNEKTQELYEKTNAALEELKDSGLFREIDNYDREYTDYDKEEQLQVIQEAYVTFAEVARAVIDEQPKEQAIIDRITAAGNGAVGEMQMEQLRQQLAAMQAAQMVRRNMLVANMTNIKSLENMINIDNEIAAAGHTQLAQVRFVDPYNPTELEKRSYDRPEGKGFVEFE